VFLIIAQNLYIRDSLAGPENGHLRNIILIGYSVREDLRILRLLSIDAASIGPILIIIDTHLMARFIFPLYYPDCLFESGQYFLPAGMLAELGCLPDRLQFYNTGNNAWYLLYAMLLLAVEAGTAREA